MVSRAAHTYPKNTQVLPPPPPGVLYLQLYMLVNNKNVLILLFLLCLFQMFHHILTREREVFWQYGEVTCAAFSLNNLDTVSKLNPTRFAIIF